MNYWLLKTEPTTYSFSQLVKDRKTNWNGVRNFQARNFMREITTGDLALVYHSGDERQVVGIAKVVAEAYPDPDPRKKGDWVQIDLAPERSFSRPVTLSQLKATAALKELLLIKQSRLSVMPVSAAHFETIVKLSETA
jgi:predicted RNA-binding protein with PUA-like domain